MKKIIAAIFLCACAPADRDLIGEWRSEKIQGYMSITNCDAEKCAFRLNSSGYGHICFADGAMTFLSKNKAEYYRSSHGAGIIFDIMPDGGIRTGYKEPHSFPIFCGMNATLEGVWKKI